MNAANHQIAAWMLMARSATSTKLIVNIAWRPEAHRPPNIAVLMRIVANTTMKNALTSAANRCGRQMTATRRAGVKASVRKSIAATQL